MAVSENAYMSAVRAGMVSVVPLTIIGGLFMIVSYFPINGWDKIVAPYLPVLQIPVTATFGLLAIFVCFAIAYDLGKQLKQEAIVSASMATVVFLMIQLKLEAKPEDIAFSMSGLGSKGLFTAIIIALVSVRVQKLFSDKNFVIRLPANVPSVVYESFLCLSPLFFLVLIFWLIRFVLGVDIDQLVQTAFKPVVFALNTLPGILVYGFLVTLLWSVGINGCERGSGDTRTAVALHHGLRFLHDVRERRRNRGDDCSRTYHVELKGTGIPESQPAVVAHSDFPDQ